MADLRHPLMKTPSNILTRAIGIATMAAVAMITLPQPLQAKDKGKGKGHSSSKGKSSQGKSNQGKSDHDDHDHDRRVYQSQPRSNFILSLGNGYAGRGYYYGPPNVPYYYQRPEVRYYATQEAAPREYYGGQGYRNNSPDAAVQQALSRRGYYQGAIDGELGPQSSRAIARYQADRGLRVTGAVNSSLLSSLGLN